MIAYIFWHRPYRHVERVRYEEALLRFHARLARTASPGFIGSGTYRIDGAPWLGDQPGYEDWCLLESSAALDPLNAAAVAGATQAPHDHVAAQMEIGHGGLYAHFDGDAALPGDTTAIWLTRPRGIDWRAALAPFRARYPDATLWRRQMVLGPAREFVVVVPPGRDVAAPPNWDRLRLNRVRLTPVDGAQPTSQ
jgi:hypothetical protein